MFARTERLLLRPGWAEDTPALLAAIGDECVVRNLALAPWPYRLSDAAAFVARRRDPARPAALIFARTMAAPRLIGGIGLHPTTAGEIELGYWIARRQWGLGYATEAGRAIIALARDGLRLDRLISGHFADNPASGNVLRKLGFHPTGTEPRGCAARGAIAPCLTYALDLAGSETRAMAA